MVVHWVCVRSLHVSSRGRFSGGPVLRRQSDKPKTPALFAISP